MTAIATGPPVADVWRNGGDRRSLRGLQPTAELHTVRLAAERVSGIEYHGTRTGGGRSGVSH